MFGAFKKHHQSDDAAGSDEEETFLPKSNSKMEAIARGSSWTDHVWKATTLLFAILFIASLFLPRPVFQSRGTYETGFDTDLGACLQKLANNMETLLTSPQSQRLHQSECSEPSSQAESL